MTVSLSTGQGNAGMAVRGDDFNASPYEALAGLLLAEGSRLPRLIWEPFCGNGALVVPLRNRGFGVQATDLVGRGCPDSVARVDFLGPIAEAYKPAAQRFGIVSNPPFDSVEEHIERATKLAPYVAFLLRFNFLESTGRQHWWSSVGLRRVHLFAERLPMMHREGYEGPKQDKGAMPMAWFIFERHNHTRRVLQVPVRWVSSKAACKRHPQQPADTPPAALEQVPPLLQIMAAVNSGESKDAAEVG